MTENLVLKVRRVFKVLQVLPVHRVQQAQVLLVQPEQRVRQDLPVHRVQLVLVSQFTDSTQTTQRWLPRNRQVNLATDTLQKMEISGYGTLKLKTGTTLVTLKVQQALLVQTV
jgi:hypothetical protein